MKDGASLRAGRAGHVCSAPASREEIIWSQRAINTGGIFYCIGGNGRDVLNHAPHPTSPPPSPHSSQAGGRVVWASAVFLDTGARLNVWETD